MTDPTYRMSMLPLGTYANPDGTESLGLAVPGMIQEPVNALMRLFGSGNFAQGPDYGSNADDMRTLLFSMYGGNALNPGRLVESAGLKDAAQAAYRTARHPFETAVSDIPAPELSNQLSNWPLPTPAAARREGRLGYDMVDELRVPNAGQTWHNMRADYPRGGASNDIDTGPLDVGYLNAILRQRKVDDGALFSDTGKPSLMGSALAGAEAPQRMYHGTASPDDFSTFRPSENGAFGPGVYLSREAESTNPYAFNGPNPRVMPVDVSGPLATYDDYLAARNASSDQAATIQALLDRGFSGVSVDNATPKGSVNVTNVFRPGSVKSATTGETLFSDTGKPSIAGAAIASAEHPQGFDVWHGSPHDFDRFDISKIGTGEGAQVYGHGLYMAEDPAIAKHYQKAVPYQVIKRQFQDALPDDADFPEVTELLGTGHFTPYQDEVLRALAKDDWLGFDYPSQAISAAYSKNIHNWDPSPELLKALDNSGYLYQAHVNANPDDFLDWGKSLPEQSASVRNAIMGREKEVEDAWTRARVGPQQTEVFKSAGIPGISYLDANSRTGGLGSRNYVLFSDDPVNILHKWRGDTQLYSDGLPSLWGNALAPSQEPRNALMDYAQNDQSHMWDHRDQPPVEDYQSVLPSDMNQFRLNWMRQYRSSHPGSGPEDAYDAYLKSPEYKEKLKGSKQIPFDQIPPGEFIPHR